VSPHPSNRYVDLFHSLRCSQEVLRAVEPLNQSSKEISEAMALIRAIKPCVMEHRGRVTLLDLCAGNALTAILAAHLLPIKEAIAVDRQPVFREAHAGVRGFSYRKADIAEPEFLDAIRGRISGPVIVTAVHPCADLASLSIDIGRRLNAVYVAVMPCCNGTMPPVPSFIADRCSAYQSFCAYLSFRFGLRGRDDTDVLSPKNVVLSGVPMEVEPVPKSLRLPKRR